MAVEESEVVENKSDIGVTNTMPETEAAGEEVIDVIEEEVAAEDEAPGKLWE